VPRFFIKLQDINNKIITLDGDQSKKVRKVLRMKPGAKIRAFDGKGWEYVAELEKITNDYSIAKVIEQERHELTTNVTLIQALPKNLKIEFILQKCTELGVDRIVFFESEFSQVDATRINQEKVKRWRRISQEAAEQCERTFLPEIELWTDDLKSLIDRIKQSEHVSNNMVYLNMDGEWLKSVDSDLNEITIFVGPEGGFAPNERRIFNSEGFKTIKIATTILRSETAGMAFLSQLAGVVGK
jgi:16S rRNA (uracil1498-N3)-methyltransferase